mmetsp:Transcript_3119/g.4816  ORF Transcript_3119/g.4816 Transcript_3119/m.4816 type:complete len:467 (-) Transcript_3119:194-1594(-)
MIPRSLDLFAQQHKIASEFKEGTSSGRICSILALVLMVWMMCVEIWVYIGEQSKYSTKVDIDTMLGSQLRLNFNISFPHLHCDFASIDLWDKIGQNQLDVTRNIEKWQLDKNGHRRLYQGRNRRDFDIEHDTHHPPLETLHADGIHAEPITNNDWSTYHEENEFSFIYFYAPWCSFCQKFHTTWERLAEETEKREIPVAIGTVDCITENDVCAEQKIQAYPTLRFFHQGIQVNQGEYRFDRTLEALLEFIDKKLESENIYKQYPEAREAHRINWNTDHPGCLVNGYLLVNRVPGNFHIQAHSRHHTLNTYNTNLSHTVHHLSFGMPMSDWQRRRFSSFGFFSYEKHHHPMDNTLWHHADEHHAWHHYMHVVPTRYLLGDFWRDRYFAYQALVSHHLQAYNQGDPPEARFAFDISPMAVLISPDHRTWYDFITSLLSLIGGAFACARLGSDLIYYFSGASAGTRRLG